MAIIEPKGLFRGERLLACSDRARLFWPYLFLGSNGYGRLELSYISIISEIFVNFQNIPEESEIWSIFKEYEDNFLVIIYESDGCWWAQFVTSQKYLPKFKTRRDENSPSPPLESIESHHLGYLSWKKSKSINISQFRILQSISAGVGVGVGVGVGEERSKPLASSDKSLPAIGTLPCLSGKSWPFTQEDVDGWKEAYPAIDVLREIHGDREWLKANPSRMKTIGGMRRHVNAWLSRAQNNSHSNGHSPAPVNPARYLREPML